jgi:hypothetical protein
MEPNEDIQDMIKSLEGIQEDKPKEEPKVEPKEEPKVEEPAVVEPVVEPVVAEPIVEAPPELETENIRLRQMINEMAKRVREPASTPPVPVVPGEEIKADKQAEVLAVIADYITDEEADQFIDQPKAVLMKVLNRFANVMQEQTLRTLPEIVGSIAQRHITMYEKVQSFYKTNKDLEEFKDFCGLVGTQVEVEHPDWSVDEVYTETAKIARARLGLRQVVKDEEVSSTTDLPTKTGLPSGHRTSRKPSGGPQLSDDQKAMVDMLGLDR